MQTEKLTQLRESVQKELTGNIFPFWKTRVLDEENDGFIGAMSNDGGIDPHADKGLILNARLLWSYSAFFRESGDEEFLQLAHRAHGYLTQHFWDPSLGGAFWMVDGNGSVVDAKKKVYGQAFCIYALVEYYLATQNESVLNEARSFYELIEKHTIDHENSGYFEAYERDWSMAEDLRLSEIDMNEKKSMNTHLHVLEAYTHLFRVWPDKTLEPALKKLVIDFLDHIIDSETHHFILFFDEKWTRKSDHISYGHDIEGSWLLVEAAKVLGDAELLKRAETETAAMAEAVLNEGFDMDGGLFHEGDPNGIIDMDKHWWPQAEAVVGLFNAFQLSERQEFLDAALKSWDFIQKHIVDSDNGEWFWKVDFNNIPAVDECKVCAWKSPYHNGRACIELLSRIQNVLTHQI